MELVVEWLGRLCSFKVLIESLDAGGLKTGPNGTANTAAVSFVAASATVLLKRMTVNDGIQGHGWQDVPQGQTDPGTKRRKEQMAWVRPKAWTMGQKTEQASKRHKESGGIQAPLHESSESAG